MDLDVPRSLYTALIALLSLTSLRPILVDAQELTYYFETFHRCESSGGRDAAESAGWTARAGGQEVGQPGYLKVFYPGKPVQELPVDAHPVGNEEGHAFWSKPVKGLSLYTEEVRAASTDIVTVELQHRTDGRDSGDQNNAVQLLLRVGSTWYVSDHSVRQIIRSRWEKVRFSIPEMTFGIATTDTPGGGPLPPAPDAVGGKLPAGEISAFGVFYARTHGKVRIDNFRIVSRTTAGMTHTPHGENCAPTIPTPSFCPLSHRKGRRLFTPDAKAGRKLVRSIKETSAIAARDRAILGLLVYSKLRTGDLVNLRRSDYEKLGGVTFLSLDRKYGSYRVIGRRAAALVEQYLAETPSHTEEDPLFPALEAPSPRRALCLGELHAIVRKWITLSRLQGLVRLIR